ncbi:MAG: outer membrane beta-barrel protein [Alphaproteobacteria bacterium]|nr:outer membrane beta-barrel protein [Alphaproteobacteria bacterium]
MSVSVRILGAVALVGTLAAGLVAGPAQARDEGLYFAIRGFGGYSDPGDISGKGTGTLSERNTADPAAGGGAALGWRLGDTPLRVEVEVLHRVRVDVDLRDNANSVGYENNLSSTTALLGLGYEFRNDSRWTPFLAAYGGLARNTSSVDRTNLNNGTVTTTENDDDNLALAAAAGFDYRLTQVLDLGASYRFSYLGGFDTGTMSGGESIDGSPFTSHDLVLSIQFNF